METDRECRQCKITKPLTDFYKNSKSRGGYMHQCKECVKSNARANREANKEEYNLAQRTRRALAAEETALQMRRAHLWKRYAITLEQYDAQFALQGFCCKICKRPREEGERHFPVDHCHSSGRLRGILCPGCNVGIGAFKDDVTLLRAAVEYLT